MSIPFKLQLSDIPLRLECNAAAGSLIQGTEPPICRGSGVDPRPPANRGWGWGWTPDPRQIGGGGGGGPPTPGKSGVGPPPPPPEKSGVAVGVGIGGSVPCCKDSRFQSYTGLRAAQSADSERGTRGVTRLLLQRGMVPLCQTCQDLVLASVTTEVQAYHLARPRN